MLSILVAATWGLWGLIGGQDIESLPELKNEPRVAIGDLEVFVRKVGEGDPIIMVHGGGLDGRMWRCHESRFQAYGQLIMVDLPGFGGSPIPSRPYKPHRLLLDLLDALEIQKAHWVGHSFGAGLVIDAALDAPERTLSVVAVAPGLSGFAWSEDLQNRLMKMVLAGQRSEKEGIRLWLEDPQMVPVMEVPRWKPFITEITTANAASLCGRVPMVFAEPAGASRLEELKAKTLVFVGERDIDDIKRSVNAVAQRAPRAKKVEVEGAGHLLTLEKSDLFERAVVAFWESLSDS